MLVVVREPLTAYSVAGDRMSHDSEDDIETRMISKENWLPPVKSEMDLPTTGVMDGAMCYVEGHVPDNDEIWEFRKGKWVRLSDE